MTFASQPSGSWQTREHCRYDFMVHESFEISGQFPVIIPALPAIMYPLLPYATPFLCTVISNRAPLPGSPVSRMVMPVMSRISRVRKRPSPVFFPNRSFSPQPAQSPRGAAPGPRLFHRALMVKVSPVSHKPVTGFNCFSTPSKVPVPSWTVMTR